MTPALFVWGNGCHRATKPITSTTEALVPCSPSSTTEKKSHCNKKPPNAFTCCSKRKPSHGKEDPAQPKINKYILNKKDMLKS